MGSTKKQQAQEIPQEFSIGKSILNFLVGYAILYYINYILGILVSAYGLPILRFLARSLTTGSQSKNLVLKAGLWLKDFKASRELQLGILGTYASSVAIAFGVLYAMKPLIKIIKRAFNPQPKPKPKPEPTGIAAWFFPIQEQVQPVVTIWTIVKSTFGVVTALGFIYASERIKSRILKSILLFLGLKVWQMIQLPEKYQKQVRKNYKYKNQQTKDNQGFFSSWWSKKKLNQSLKETKANVQSKKQPINYKPLPSQFNKTTETQLKTAAYSKTLIERLVENKESAKIGFGKRERSNREQQTIRKHNKKNDLRNHFLQVLGQRENKK